MFYLMVMYVQMKNAKGWTHKLLYLAAIALLGIINLEFIYSIGWALVLLWGPRAKMYSIKFSNTAGFATYALATAPTILGIVRNPAGGDVWDTTDVI